MFEDISLIVTVLLASYGGLIAITWHQQKVNLQLKQEVTRLKTQMQPLWRVIEKAVPEILYEGKELVRTNISVKQSFLNALFRKSDLRISKKIANKLEDIRCAKNLDSIEDVIALLLEEYLEMPLEE